MNSAGGDFDDDSATLEAWPSFVDLLASMSMLFLTLFAIRVFIGHAREAGLATNVELLSTRLSAAPEANHLFSVRSDGQQVVVTLQEVATFPKDSASLTSLRGEGKIALERLGGILGDSTIARMYREVLIVGHTDQIPFVSRNRSNWELSSARAAVVARFLVENTFLDPCKVQATGAGPFHPLQPSEAIPTLNAEEREQNRRIEITIIPSKRKGAPELGGCYPLGDGAARQGS